MKFFIPFFIVIIFVSFIVVAQPIRLNSNNGLLDLLDGPCGTPGICQICIDLGKCNDGCIEIDCADCIAINCNEGIPIDGGLVWLLIAGFGLKVGKVFQMKRKNKKSHPNV